MFVHSFKMNSRKRLAGDVIYTTATHTGHVHDSADLVKMAALTAVFSRLSNVDEKQKQPPSPPPTNCLKTRDASLHLKFTSGKAKIASFGFINKFAIIHLI